jgi:hypothetical protein
MWIFYETYDPLTKAVLLDLQSDGIPPPFHEGPLSPHMLEAFTDIDDARDFGDVYVRSITRSGVKVAKTVYCGPDRPAACQGPGHPCALGFDSYRCPFRCAP